jgi:hypothetical protein
MATNLEIIRAGSRFKRFLCFVLINVRCFRVPPGVRVPQVEDHWKIGAGIAMDYELDCRGSVLHNVNTVHGTHQTSYPMRIWGSFLGSVPARA